MGREEGAGGERQLRVSVHYNHLGLAISTQRGEKGVGAAGWGRAAGGTHARLCPWAREHGPTLRRVKWETFLSLPDPHSQTWLPLGDEAWKQEEPQGGRRCPVTAPAHGRARNGEEKLPTPVSWSSPPGSPATAGRQGKGPWRRNAPTSPLPWSVCPSPLVPAGLGLKQPLTPATSPANKTPCDWSPSKQGQPRPRHPCQNQTLTAAGG